MFQRLLRKIARALRQQHIPYMVIGGQAVLLYGEPRLTKDIDVTLGIGLDRWNEIEEIARSIRLKPVISDIEDFIKDTMVFPLIDEQSGIRVDFIFSHSVYERQAIERARGIYFGQTEVKFAALEDVVIHKMIAERAKDIEDLKSMLLKNPDYDADYIKKWLTEFDRSLGKKFNEAFLLLKRDLKRHV